MIKTEQIRNVQSEMNSPPQMVESETSARTTPDDADETLYLLGRPTLRQYLRFVRHHAATPSPEAVLTDEWNVAGDIIRSLEKEEAGLADDPVITKLGPEYEPLLIEFLKDPLIRNGFNTVPTEVAMIELDQLVVYQKHIDLTYARRLQEKLSSKLNREDLFRACLPYDHPQPPVKWSKHGEKFIFVSPSNDLRFLGHMSLKPENIAGYPPPGNLVGVVGLALGFGSNFLNAAYINKRLILHNGSHRAYALRALGVTHVPCIIEHVSSPDEVDLVASSEVRSNPDLYLKHPRPPMLRDYFNPQLFKVTPVHRVVRQVTVKFDVEESFAPAL